MSGQIHEGMEEWRVWDEFWVDFLAPILVLFVLQSFVCVCVFDKQF